MICAPACRLWLAAAKANARSPAPLWDGAELNHEPTIGGPCLSLNGALRRMFQVQLVAGRRNRYKRRSASPARAKEVRQRYGFG
jgi:hypothetical protein